ncbi:MAG: cisplatin damage response ATP-dependent DNA ligase, partial [Mesorhizobium sp.]|nr:cisplatin damage response ATP-dependent DNA ligase [Mesorhizobium sp.]
MRPFAELLDRLVLTPSRNGKLTLLVDYFRNVPDPDRGLALAAITGDLDIPAVKPAMLRTLVTERMDPVLFGYSYDYVGDLAETISLVWPDAGTTAERELRLSDVVARLQRSSRADGPKLIATLLDALDIPARFALIKLATGGLRIGVSARLAKQALADFGGKDANEIEELWHGLKPPYAKLFAWLEGTAEKPVSAAFAMFRPVMLAHPVEDRDLERIDPADYAAEWKWDGIRVQASAEGGARRLYSRTGDDVATAFPDLLHAMDFEAVIDGELLVGSPSATGSFSDLQQRLNRKTVSAKLAAKFPAFMRCYDLLQHGGEDLRPLPFMERRARLEALMPALDPARFDLSPFVTFQDWPDLDRQRMA